ncbi:MAG: DUF1761 domain-containing protein [Methanobacteriota archaeon]|nr:MAG: DUF1761 domain-containing protein [Euryarchaeota archaeon]
MASNSRVLSLAMCKTISVASARSAGLPLPFAGMADDGHPNYLRAEKSADRNAYMAAPAVPGGAGAMVSFDVSSFNWIAIVMAGVSAWIIGAIWFSPPVFGRRWMAALGLKQEQLGNPAPGFVAALVISIIGATFLRWVIGVAGATSVGDGIEVALIIWFAFILLPSAPGLLFTKQSGTAFALTQVQHAIAMSAMGIVLTAYR